MIGGGAADLRIRRARVTGPPTAAPLRRQLEAALAAVDLDRVGLSPRSILLVRHMATAQPLGSTAASVFAGNLTLTLREQARGAARPLRDGPSTAASAVLFDCEADLVTAVILYRLTGWLDRCWWWAAISGGQTYDPWFQRHGLPRGDLMPAVIVGLASAGRLMVWLRSLSDVQAQSAAQAIAVAHGWTAASPAALIHVLQCQNQTALRQIERGSGVGSRGDNLPTGLSEQAEFNGQPGKQWLLALGRGSQILADPVPGREIPATVAAMTVDHGPEVADRQPIPEAEVAPATTPLAKSAGAVANTARFTAVQTPNFRTRAFVGADGDPRPPEIQIPSPETAIDRPGRLERTLAQDDWAARTQTIRPRLDTIQTQYGGLFYLLNVTLDLGFYGDFTRPRQLGLEISPWSLLALVGRAAFGRRFTGDGVWPVLGQLAAWQAAAPPRLSSGVLRGHMMLLRQRLQLALGAAGQGHVWRFVCRHDAAIDLTATAVDVSFPLSGLPLALRIAGLDRDPGWIPAAGRTIAFHFR